MTVFLGIIACVLLLAVPAFWAVIYGRNRGLFGDAEGDDNVPQSWHCERWRDE